MRSLVSDDHGEDFSSDYLDHSLAKMTAVEVAMEEKLEGKGEADHTFLEISPSTFFSFSSEKIKYHIKRQISSEIQRILRERKVEMRE